MEIYLIRHTTPAIADGTCYGQADLDVSATFAAEAAEISKCVPQTIIRAVSSPLARCRKLAAVLFPALEVKYYDDLKEIDCGSWELKKWNDIPEASSRTWANDFVNTPFPGGENYLQLQHRVIAVFNTVVETAEDTAIVTHGGVIRSILASITQTPLVDSFDRFHLPIGCVIRLKQHATSFEWEIEPRVNPYRCI